MHIQCLSSIQREQHEDAQDLYILAGVQLYTSPFRGRACTTSSLEDLDVKKKKKSISKYHREKRKTLSVTLSYRWSYLHDDVHKTFCRLT